MLKIYRRTALLTMLSATLIPRVVRATSEVRQWYGDLDLEGYIFVHPDALPGLDVTEVRPIYQVNPDGPPILLFLVR